MAHFCVICGGGSQKTGDAQRGWRHPRCVVFETMKKWAVADFPDDIPAFLKQKI